MHRPRTAVLLLLLAPVLSSCGGGGGGGQPPPDPQPLLLDGTYSFASIGAQSVGSSTVFSQAGQMTSDGQSQLDLVTSFANVNGAVVQALPVSAAFTVDAEGIVTLTSALGGSFRGQISDDGNLLAVSASSAGSPPSILLAVRSVGPFGLGSLSGTYFFGTIRAAQTPELSARFGTVVFDGTGGAPTIGSNLRNTNGSVVVGAGGPDTGTYAVFADGSVSYTGALGSYFGGLD